MARYYFLASCLPPMPLSLGEKISLPFEENMRVNTAQH